MQLGERLTEADVGAATPEPASAEPPRLIPAAPELAEFERRVKRELGLSLGIAMLGFVCGFGPLLAASLLAGDWSVGVVAWALGGAVGFLAFLVGLPLGRRVARTGDRLLAKRFLGAVLGLSAVLGGAFLVFR